MSQTRAAVAGIAYHLPDGVETNEQLAAKFPAWDAAKILAKTGIVSRRVAAPGECASDLGVAAARALFEAGACDPSAVDFLIVCTQSPDHFLPATACLVQDRLGLPTSCGALDLNQGCSGFVYGLAAAKGLVETGAARRVLLVTADTYTRYVNRRDRAARTIFGDGAAATLVAAVGSDAEPIGPFVFGTDGRGAEHLIVPAGAHRLPPSAETAVERDDGGGNWRSARDIAMNGPEVFAFTLRAVPEAVRRLLDAAGLGPGDVDHYVFHQANQFMLERLREKLEIPPERFALAMADIGNTVSSSIPIALERERASGRIRPGDRVMLVGFGVGYSWAAAMIRIP